MSESKNPYKYGEEYEKPSNGDDYTICGIVDDIVYCCHETWGNGSNVTECVLEVEIYHWIEFERVFNIKPKKGWVDITKDNWMEYRDKIVWMHDGDFENEPSEARKLIYFNPLEGLAHPLMGAEEDGDTSIWRHASILNEAGEPATWEES